MSNALLSPSYLPEFEKIKLEDIEPAITSLLEKNKTITHAILEKGEYTFESLVLPLELLNAEFEETWSIVNHLNYIFSFFVFLKNRTTSPIAL